MVDLSKIKGGIAPPEESAFMGVCETQHGSRCVLYTLPPGFRKKTSTYEKQERSIKITFKKKL